MILTEFAPAHNGAVQTLCKALTIEFQASSLLARTTIADAHR